MFFKINVTIFSLFEMFGLYLNLISVKFYLYVNQIFQFIKCKFHLVLKHKLVLLLSFLSVLILSINEHTLLKSEVKEIALPPYQSKNKFYLSMNEKSDVLFDFYLKHRNIAFHKNKNTFVSFLKIKENRHILTEKEDYLDKKIMKDYQVNLEEIMCLVENSYREARNQSFKGKQGVANTVLNRMKLTGDDACAVIRKGRIDKVGNFIKDKCHFSWICERDNYEDFSDEYNLKTEWLIAYKAVKKAFQEDITNGATLYHAYYVKPWWVKDKNISFTKKIDDQFFYKEKNYGKNKGNLSVDKTKV